MRNRIYGLETEYALLFYPENPGDPVPSQKHIYDLFAAMLQENYACAPAWYRKQGHFLGNSLLLHYEARGDSYYQGLIEGCTPECLSPREVIVYQRTLDEILRELSVKTEEKLAAQGFTGRLVIGKNSVDSHGNSYGCHENYWVSDPVYKPLWVIYPLLLLAVVAVGVPILLVLSALLALVFSFFFVCAVGNYLSVLLGKIPGIGWLFRGPERFFHVPLRLIERIPEQEWLKILNYVMQFSFLPPVAIFSAVLCRTTFRDIRHGLTSFLVTRLVYTGSGKLAFDEDAPGLHLSQRGDAIRSVMKIFWDDLNKPIFDLKNFIFEIFSPLRSTKRLHILLSDSNMSEAAQYLKIGATSLVIRMIESGVSFERLELKSPIKSLRKASKFGHGALLDMKNGEQKSVLQIQREYLDAAGEFFRINENASEEERLILELWGEMLDGLDANPAQLSTHLDWVAKKRLMDEFILERTNWVKFSQWGTIIQRLRELEPGKDFGDHSFDGLSSVLKPKAFASLEKMAERYELETEEFQFYYDLFFEIKKIDLRYHEISGEGGYCHWLEEQEMIRRITSEEELERARHTPPPFTRAHIRGQYVVLCSERKYDALIGWHKIRNRTLRQTIFLEDPFQYEIDLPE